MKLLFDIDFVFPWVNDKDPVWRGVFVDYCKTHHLTSKIEELEKERYRDWGLLKYLLRSIAFNMPWIRKLHLIVSNPEQVPLWINTMNINIVLHKSFIPEKFLPTFNSTTIEMFLPNIPDLAEHFIYSNDDLFMFNPSEPSDWFTEDGKPKNNLHYITSSSIKGLQFRVVCARQWWKMVELLGQEQNKKEYGRPWHGAHALVKTYCKEALNLYGTETVEKSISAFRESKNMNQYIYTNYCFLKGLSAPSGVTLDYASAKTAKNILDALTNSKAQTLCINDCNNRLNKLQIAQLQILCEKILETKWPQICKYEDIKEITND